LFFEDIEIQKKIDIFFMVNRDLLVRGLEPEVEQILIAFLES
jgi:hypothetical protein